MAELKSVDITTAQDFTSCSQLCSPLLYELYEELTLLMTLDQMFSDVSVNVVKSQKNSEISQNVLWLKHLQ